MSSLFKTPAPPQPVFAPPMPDAQSPQVLNAEQQSAAAATSRAGRQSTILGLQGAGNPAKASPVGTDTYAGSQLGN